MSDPIPYDDMRALLGLPDVRDAVARERLGLAVNRANTALVTFGQALGAALTEAGRRVAEALAPGGRP